jgi:hypothetical protein
MIAMGIGELRETALSKKRQSRPEDRIIFGGQ